MNITKTQKIDFPNSKKEFFQFVLNVFIILFGFLWLGLYFIFLLLGGKFNSHKKLKSTLLTGEKDGKE